MQERHWQTAAMQHGPTIEDQIRSPYILPVVVRELSHYVNLHIPITCKSWMFQHYFGPLWLCLRCSFVYIFIYPQPMTLLELPCLKNLYTSPTPDHQPQSPSSYQPQNDTFHGVHPPNQALNQVHVSDAP